VDLETFRRLRSAAGAELLARLMAAGPLDDAAALALGTALRRTHPADLVAAAITTARLRVRAEAKFGTGAADMWFTPEGLEQATHPIVAEHRAARLAAVLDAGVTALDLCCGIGSDSRALARAGLRVTGVELDPLTAAMAAANVGSLATILTADATTVEPDAAAVFVDPTRRGARGRVFDPDAYVPPWRFVEGLLSRPGSVAAKVAPGIPHEIVPAGVEIEWVSLRRELKEAALYAGPPGSGGGRRATLLPGGESVWAPGRAEHDVVPPVGGIGRWLYEPDPAVIRAHLVGAVVEQVDGRLVDPAIAYVISDRFVATPFARVYEVSDVMPFKVPAVRTALRSRSVGTLTIKQRGTAVVPDLLRRELLAGSRGANSATLVVTRVRGRHTALLVEPHPEGAQP